MTRAAVRRRLDRVGDQVDERLLEPARIALRRRVARPSSDERHAGLIGAAREHVEHVARERRRGRAARVRDPRAAARTTGTRARIVSIRLISDATTASRSCVRSLSGVARDQLAQALDRRRAGS